MKNSVKTIKASITKAIIPIAGLGSRFLPITKSVSKEMLNIVDKPVVQYLLEECLDSGIKEIIFVIGENQTLIKDYFDLKSEYCKKLKEAGKIEKLNELKNILEKIKINFVIQKNPKGDGDAILRAENFFKEGENFAILFGDDLIQNKKNPALKQLMQNFEKNKGFVIGVQKISGKEIENYGVIGGDFKKSKNLEVEKIQEKPNFQEAFSDLGIIGKYICNYGIFEAIKIGNNNLNFNSDGEIRLSNGFYEILKNKKETKNKIFGEIIKGERYDTGSKNGFIKAQIGFGIEKGIIKKEEILDFLKKI